MASQMTELQAADISRKIVIRKEKWLKSYECDHETRQREEHRLNHMKERLSAGNETWYETLDFIQPYSRLGFSELAVIYSSVGLEITEFYNG